MFSKAKWLLPAGLMLALMGCASDRPHEYGLDRPPVDQVDPRDTGLQSIDVVATSDKMAASLLSNPKLNASQTQWTMVVDHVEDQTTDRTFGHDYDIFIERLRTKLFQQSGGRIQLIENRARFHDLRNRELEGGRDYFGQGDGGRDAPGGAIQPNYVLYGKALDLPNRATNYYQLQFVVTDFHTRAQVWGDMYEVRAVR